MSTEDFLRGRFNNLLVMIDRLLSNHPRKLTLNDFRVIEVYANYLIKCAFNSDLDDASMHKFADDVTEYRDRLDSYRKLLDL